MKLISNIKSTIKEKMDFINDTMVSYNIQRYYQDLANVRGISYGEAVELCETDPEASLGLKLADPENIFKCTTKKGTERFKKTLSPEELEIFIKDEKNIRKSMIRGAKGKAI